MTPATTPTPNLETDVLPLLENNKEAQVNFIDEGTYIILPGTTQGTTISEVKPKPRHPTRPAIFYR